MKAALIEVLATRRASDQLPAFLAATLDDSAQVRSAAMRLWARSAVPTQIAAMLPGVLKAEKGGRTGCGRKERGAGLRADRKRGPARHAP